MASERDSTSVRGTIVSAALVMAIGSFFLFILFAACGGLGVFLLATVVGLGIFLTLHYLLWGQSFSRSVEGERETDALRETLETEDWFLEDPSRPRRLL